MLSVGLSSCVYLWSACNSQVVKLCDLSSDNDSVTSVQWSERGDYLAVGTQKGNLQVIYTPKKDCPLYPSFSQTTHFALQVWDTHVSKKIHDLPGHQSRIGCLAWNGETVCSGSRDRFIIHRDMRDGNASERRLNAHRQEVANAFP